MTAGTVHTVAAFVRIVLRVAAKAGDRRADHAGGLFVAGVAGGAAMQPAQRKLGHLVMVKADLLPPLRVVA